MVHFARVAALDDETNLGALTFANEVVVHGAGQQQRRNRCIHRVTAAIRQHDDSRAIIDEVAHLVANAVERRAHAVVAIGHAIEPAHHRRAQVRHSAVVVDVDDLGQLVVVDDGERQHQLSAVLRPNFEQIRLGSECRTHRRHDFFTNCVERRVRDLCEQLLEVVEQQSWSCRQHRERRVGAHRANRFGRALGHRCDDHLHVFMRVAEHLLSTQHTVVTVHHVFAIGQFGQRHHAVGQPLRIRRRGGERAFDLFIVDDSAERRVDQQHAAGLETTLAHHSLRCHVHHAHFACRNDEVVIGDPIAARA